MKRIATAVLLGFLSQASSARGFHGAVRFAIDPESGSVNLEVTSNTPGLEALATADLMILNTRFRNLPDAPVQHFKGRVRSAGPKSSSRSIL